METLPNFIIVILLIGYVDQTHSIVAFDCGGPAINISSFDLLESSKCVEGDVPVRSENVTIQLLQLKRWDHVHVYHCKIHVLRNIVHCGMHSHVSMVSNGLMQYVLPLTKRQCLSIHESSAWSPGSGKMIDGLTGNATHYRTLTLSGKLTSDGACTGGSYSDSNGNWDNVVVQVSYQISLYDQEVAYDIDTETIKMPSGTSCLSTFSECIDIEKGYTFWSSLYEQSCTNTRHNVLYEGMATRMEESGEDPTLTKNIVYIVQNEGFSFTFSIKSRTTICGINLYSTDHPRLLIHHPEDGVFYFKKSKMVTEDMDMFAYINSKFVYVEQHLKSQMISLYRNTMQHKCSIEQQTIHNLMNLAISDPELFAYSYMKVPGYTAVRAGELIHIVKCVAVDVSVRPSNRCYNDLPIVYNNQSKFMTPRNHLIVNKGVEIPCTPMLYPAYRLQGSWYEMSPTLHETNPPQQISISKHVTWKYKSPSYLATTGIYSENDINKLRDHIMFPTEKQAITNIIAQGVNQMKPDLQHLSIIGLMDDTTLDKITQSYAEKMWGVFVWVGNAISGVMGLWFSWKCLCFLWNTTIHGLSLYQTFGVSLRLLTAVSGSLSHYMLHKHNNKDPEPHTTYKEREDGSNSCTQPNAPEQELLNVHCSVSDNQRVRQSELYPTLPTPKPYNRVDV